MKKKDLAYFLEHCPGPVGELARLIDASFPFSLPGISLATSLSFFGTLKCGRVESADKIQPNLYCGIIAESGVGKGRAISAFRDIQSQCGLDLEIGKPRSDAGLIRGITDKPGNRGVIIWDEWGIGLNELAASKQGPRALILSEMLTLFTAGQKYIGAELADGRRPNIPEPYLNLLCFSTPIRFFESLTDLFIHDGNLPRFLIFFHDLNPNTKRQISKSIILPQSLKDYIKSVEAWTPAEGNLGEILKVKKKIVSYQMPAIEAQHRSEFEFKSQNTKLPPLERVAWTRYYEQYVKLCMVLNPTTVIDEGVDVSFYAAELAEYLIETQIARCKESLGQNEQSRTKDAILNCISVDDGWTSLRDITRCTRKLKLSRHERQQIILDLCESEQWEKTEKDSPDSQRVTTYYRRQNQTT